ncbi:MAG: CDP-alcohol phosphatidyltransferase family protein [Acidobacteriota bacterium]
MAELMRSESVGATKAQEDLWEERLYLAVRRLRDLLLAPLVTPLAALGVPPTLLSCAGVALAASLIWSLERAPALALGGFVAALLCDALDGALARRQGCESALGKLWDQLCDSATWAAVLVAVLVAGLAPPVGIALAIYLGVLLLFLGVVESTARRPGAWWVNPRAGFFAHLPKIFVYGAILVYLLSERSWIPLAVVVSNGFALAGVVGLLVALKRRG